ncbi:MAG TPA: DUF5808 domain-containing protein [Flavobacterium sp.]|uniref:hypothetical protein n=1 Tax=Flavobacterium sp. TaxID=239 RepID=UPI002D11BB0D|nr:hypothetical protein [Flavobacterium sp.]HNP33409.1 DUF5808 domain-containing protein [Flavobacterium sp.]
MDKSQKELEESWHDDPKNWKLGAFYFNKDDKRVFTSKRNPEYGITVNFANPKSYLFLFLCFCFFGFVIYMLSINKKAS